MGLLDGNIVKAINVQISFWLFEAYLNCTSRLDSRACLFTTM